MDISLEQILENYFSTENSFAKHLSIKIIQNLNFDEKPSNEYLIDVNQFSFQLLLLTSHFLSQAASAYHLPIAYLDLSNSTESDFENTLKSISLRIPTSIRVVAGRLKNDQITFKQFEKKSTHNLNSKSNFDEDSFNKFGAIVVNVNNEPTIALQVLLEKFFASNMAVFYILLVCPFDVSFNDFKIKGDNSTKIYRHQDLKSSIVLITNVEADSYQNLFQFEIDKLNSNDIFNTLRLFNPLKPLKADDFPNSKQIRKIQQEK